MFTENDRSTASELDGMPDVDRKETQDILAEIEKDEKPVDQKPIEQKPEPKPEEKPADDSARKPDEQAPDEKKHRTPGLMPRYVHEIALKDKDTLITKLQQEVEALKSGKGPQSEDKPKTPEEQKDLTERIQTMASKLSEKHQGISKELIADLAMSLVETGITSTANLPKDVQDKLKQVDQWSAEKQVQAEEAAFRTDFEKVVLPLVKSEYGDLPDDTISAIRELMMQKAYDENLGKTPLDVLYKGLEEFRAFKRLPSRSAEPTRGGQERTGDGVDNDDSTRFENATESDIDKMSPEEFDRYTKWAEDRERGRSR